MAKLAGDRGKWPLEKAKVGGIPGPRCPPQPRRPFVSSLSLLMSCFASSGTSKGLFVPQSIIIPRELRLPSYLADAFTEICFRRNRCSLRGLIRTCRVSSLASSSARSREASSCCRLWLATHIQMKVFHFGRCSVPRLRGRGGGVMRG